MTKQAGRHGMPLKGRGGVSLCAAEALPPQDRQGPVSKLTQGSVALIPHAFNT